MLAMGEKKPNTNAFLLEIMGIGFSSIRYLGVANLSLKECDRCLIWAGAGAIVQPHTMKDDLRQLGMDLSRMFQNALFLEVSFPFPWFQSDPSEDLQHLHKPQDVNQSLSLSLSLPFLLLAMFPC